MAVDKNGFIVRDNHYEPESKVAEKFPEGVPKGYIDIRPRTKEELLEIEAGERLKERYKNISSEDLKRRIPGEIEEIETERMLGEIDLSNFFGFVSDNSIRDREDAVYDYDSRHKIDASNLEVKTAGGFLSKAINFAKKIYQDLTIAIDEDIDKNNSTKK